MKERIRNCAKIFEESFAQNSYVLLGTNGTYYLWSSDSSWRVIIFQGEVKWLIKNGYLEPTISNKEFELQKAVGSMRTRKFIWNEQKRMELLESTRE